MQQIKKPAAALYDPYAYSAANEIEFLRKLAVRRPAWFKGYATLILRDLRAWDSTVDVGKVKAECERLMEVAG